MGEHRPYERAKPWTQTRAEIDALLARHNIDDVQWTTASSRERGVLRFSKHLLEGTYRPPNDKIVVVQVEFAFPLMPAERNRTARHLLWYLKAKLEAVEFRLSDGTRMFDFEREFFAHILTDNGRTVYDEVGETGVRAFAARADSIALSGGVG